MHKVGVYGASGRMGQRVMRMLEILSPKPNIVTFDKGDAHDFRGCDVVIDFSLPEATETLIETLEHSNAALVTGVTGRCEAQLALINELALDRAVLQAANFSLGVHVLGHLVDQAAQLLDSQFQIEVVEAHHRHKKDLPSGTALYLARTAASARGDEFEAVYADRSRQGAREDNREIGVAGIRGGAVIGDHTVHFLGDEECLALTHSATDRDVFARGAVRVAQWLSKQPIGDYSMNDFIAVQLGTSND